MSTIRVHLSERAWQDLVSLGEEERVSPGELLEQAVRYYLRERRERRQARRGLQESFGIWKDRDDLKTASTAVVEGLREEWGEREQRLGLA